MTDPLQDLEKARAALVLKRLAWAKAIATPGDIPQAAITGIVEVQQAIEVVELAMEDLQEADELEDED